TCRRHIACEAISHECKSFYVPWTTYRSDAIYSSLYQRRNSYQLGRYSDNLPRCLADFSIRQTWQIGTRLTAAFQHRDGSSKSLLTFVGKQPTSIPAPSSGESPGAMDSLNYRLTSLSESNGLCN